MPNKQLADTYTNWEDLTHCAEAWQTQTLASVFANDTNRYARYSINAAGLIYDYSKNHIDEEAMRELVSVCQQADLSGAIKRLMRGDKINNTEDRPALHTALRYQGPAKTEEHHAVNETLQKMAGLIESVHSQTWKGFTGKAITDVVKIRNGGSDLGPRMITKALTPFHTKHVKVHFVANVDGAEIHGLTESLNPSTTLFLIASKSFSTQETLHNALAARSWMLNHGCAEKSLAKHFIAISSKVDKAVEFGIDADNVYPIWDWVGGRYSLWSAIGMPIAFAVGMDNFNALRKGAALMDTHFAEAPFEKNIPVIMAMLMFWYTNMLKCGSQAVLPYAHHLQLLPNYLQQLEMESNGKSTSRDGQPLGYQTGSVVWGTEGSNGQHSFHQLLHQGTKMCPIDFIASLTAHHPLQTQHDLLFANCVAQSQALLTGRDLKSAEAEMRAQGFNQEEIDKLAIHKVHPGNRPSSMFILDSLTPETLGSLIAAYEHKVFTLGTLWQINPFDQWGVELGKLLGNHVVTALHTSDIPNDWDSSTRNLVSKYINRNTRL